MRTKSFIVILLVAVLFVVSVYGAYQFGSSSGFKNGQNSIIGPMTRMFNNTWNQGYQAGFVAGQNKTIPHYP